MNSPRISVVVANYNHARYLPTCLGALLNQRVLPHEIIVVDDASTDNSREVLDEFARKSPLIKLHPNEKNLGTCRTQNRGMEFAGGDYVVFPSADDQVGPNLFEKLTEMLRAYPQAGICGGLCEWRYAETGVSWVMGAGMPNRACYLTPEEMIPLGRAGRLTISGQHAAYNKSFLLQAGGLRPELRWCADWFAAFVVGFRHGICHVPEVMSYFNLHPSSYFNAPRPAAERRQVYEQIMLFLQSNECADVMPLIRSSGVFGGFGWLGLRVVLASRRNRTFLTWPLARMATRRCGETIGARFFPKWLARACVSMFYGRSSANASTLDSASVKPGPARIAGH